MSSLIALDLFAHRLQISRTPPRDEKTGFDPNIIIDEYNSWIDSAEVEDQDPYHMILYRYLCGIFQGSSDGECLRIDAGNRDRAVHSLILLLRKAHVSRSSFLPSPTWDCLAPEAPDRVQRYKAEWEKCRSKGFGGDTCNSDDF